MSITGGYKIIDFKGYQFGNGVPVKIPGIYDLIRSSDKPSLISGFTLTGSAYQDFFTTFVPFQGGFICYARLSVGAHIVMNVKSDDTFTATQTNLSSTANINEEG